MNHSSVRLAVIGGGRMARALARILSATNADVHLYARNPERRAELAQDLRGVTVDAELGPAIEDAHLVFFAVPADSLPEAAEAYGPFARGDHIVLIACRGVGPDFTLPHTMIRSRTCIRKIGALGGPVHARELTAGHQINAVIGSRYNEVIEATRALTKGAPVTIHGSKDIVGVQVAGAIANVAAIAVGMAEALELSNTARGVVLAHGLVDARRLGTHLGADERTFFGLAGVGELIPRNVTSMDRHVAFGRMLAHGHPTEVALRRVDGTVEGVHTAAMAVKKAAAVAVKLPLVEAVQSVLEGRTPAFAALDAVLHESLELA